MTAARHRVRLVNRSNIPAPVMESTTSSAGDGSELAFHPGGSAGGGAFHDAAGRRALRGPEGLLRRPDRRPDQGHDAGLWRKRAAVTAPLLHRRPTGSLRSSKKKKISRPCESMIVLPGIASP